MSHDPLQIPVTGLVPEWICVHAASDAPPGSTSSSASRNGARPDSALEAVVKSDPGLAFHLLRLANSSFAGLRGKVSTLSHAIAVLGRGSLRHLALGALARLEPPASGKIRIDADDHAYFARSLHTACLARCLAEHVGYDLPEEAYVTGLLHATGIHLETSGSRAKRDTPPTPRTAARRAGALARQSHVPRTLAAAIARHEDPISGISRLADRTKILTLATAAAAALARESRQDGGPDSERADATLEALGIRRHVADRLARDAERALLELVRSAGSEFASLDDFYLETSAERTAVVPETLLNAAPAGSHSMRSLGRVSRELLSKTSWVEVLETLVHLLRTDVGFDRVVYLERLRTGGKLAIARFGDETHLNPPIDDWTITLGRDERSLTRAVRRKEAVVTRDTVHDAGILHDFGTRSMALAPIVVKKQVVGVLAVDHYVRGLDVTDADLGALEVLAQKTGLLLEKLELETQGRKLRKIAEKDPLTGINNRRSCLDLCRKEIERARRYRAALSVVLIDIDNFKDFNDSYGHAAGDRVLRDLARLVESNSRRTDVIGRFGGDEFLAILPQITGDRAITYAERLRLRTAELGSTLAKRYPRCHLAISLGVATWTKGDRMDDVIAAADKALYAAKDRGRNRVCTTE